jgi:peptide/nickel transport system ATP-binding protein
MPLLTVDKLNVRFATQDGEVHAVKDLSFELERDETLGIVGESGSGKSQSMLALMGLVADNGSATGSAKFQGRELLGLPERELRRIRGSSISMIFQDPMTSLNPYLTIGAQMTQVLHAHERVSSRAARARCVDMLTAVKIPDAQARLDRYPHELSGGMRQRVMIAASLLLNPELLIADEPTTALDVTVQAQILELMKELGQRFGTATVLITHDLGVVAGLAGRVLVMHDGELKEQGAVDDIFYRPQHPYTKALLAAVPRLDVERVARLATVAEDKVTRTDALEPAATDPAAHAAVEAAAPGAAPLLAVEDLSVHFPVAADRWWGKRRTLKAVDHVSLELMPGETLGVVGESGCGKSTLARAILKLVPTSGGVVLMYGRSLTDMTKQQFRPLKRDLQVVFQDPLASLNPRMTVGDIVSEPLWVHRPELGRAEVRAEVTEVLRRVGLTGRELNRYPHEFSGGQCQRIGIARALVLKPKLIVCDEPVSALDVSIQAQIVNLLMDLRQELGISLIFIAHDLAVVRHISHRVMVMYLGAVMELATREALYERPAHPYTRALISAVPLPDPVAERSRPREILSGDLPSPIDPPSGCRFRTRCRYVVDRCVQEVPPLRRYGSGSVACHRAEELDAADAAELTAGEAAAADITRP